MSERLKKIRKELGLTQREFGRRLGVQDTAISKIEKGDNGLTEQMILAICREFNVNENWLRTGEGGEEAMFNEDSDSVLESLMQENRLDEMSRKILRAFWDMPPKKRERASDFIYALSRAVLEDDIDGVHKDITDIINNFRTHDIRAKADLNANVNLAFNERFPYVGIGNMDIDEAESISEEAATITPTEDERYAEWNKGLTEEEEVALVRKRHAALKKGLPESTTYEKHGQSETRKAK